MKSSLYLENRLAAIAAFFPLLIYNIYDYIYIYIHIVVKINTFF